MRIGLISCVQKKGPVAAPAHDLYQSPLFKKSYAYAARHFDKVYILLAKYGLVEPTRVIAPYEQSLNKMTIAERLLWAIGVHRQLVPLLQPEDVVYFLAGLRYREPLAKMLPCKYEVPLKGLEIGYQLQWYNQQAEQAHV